MTIIWVVIGVMGAITLGAWVRLSFLRVQNNALEKSCLGEARQISSAANQYFAEHAVSKVRVSALGAYLSGQPGAGKQIGTDLLHLQSGKYAKMTMELTATGYFYVAHPGYEKPLSTSPWARQSGGGDHALKFSVSEGRLVHEDGSAINP